MRRRLPWLVMLAVVLLCSCRELIGVDEAALDPALADAGDGAGGEGGFGD
jgi:hypothetical protein